MSATKFTCSLEGYGRLSDLLPKSIDLDSYDWHELSDKPGEFELRTSTVHKDWSKLTDNLPLDIKVLSENDSLKKATAVFSLHQATKGQGMLRIPSRDQWSERNVTLTTSFATDPITFCGGKSLRSASSATCNLSTPIKLLLDDTPEQFGAKTQFTAEVLEDALFVVEVSQSKGKPFSIDIWGRTPGQDTWLIGKTNVTVRFELSVDEIT